MENKQLEEIISKLQPSDKVQLCFLQEILITLKNIENLLKNNSVKTKVNTTKQIKKDIRLCTLKTNDLVAGAPPQNISNEFYTKLVESIKQDGITEPILVINTIIKGNKTYLVKVGNSRLWAARELKIEEMKCIVVTLERDIDLEKPQGLILNSEEQIKSLFKHDVMWIERENYVGMKCTHFHQGDKTVK